MSSGGSCSCGSDCKCGSGCKCGMYPDLGYSENTTTATIIAGLATMKSGMSYEASEMSFGAENGCKCGSSCSCDSCSCHK